MYLTQTIWCVEYLMKLNNFSEYTRVNNYATGTTICTQVTQQVFFHHM
jgi:hypothetical protein